MTSARRKLLVQYALRRRLVRVVVPAAVATAVTGSVVGVAIADKRAEQPARPTVAAKPMHVEIDPADSPYLAARVSAFSRSAKRVTLREKPEVTDRKWLTAPLNLGPAPKEHGKPLAVLAEGGQVGVTGARRAGFAQILRQGQVRWVNADYLADEKPEPPKKVVAAPQQSPSSSPSTTSAPGSSPASGGPCPSGSSMESGIVAEAVALHRAICAQFPQVTEYGGYRADGEHSDGHAIDVMVYSDSGTGQAVADWLRANADALHVDDIIWAQHIWTTQRGSEGWRSMPDRGSVTANHYDHVHVRVL